MARRSDHTREELKGMAILAGVKLMEEKGFSGFSARAVAREIGYTVGTLYNIFTDHDDLVLHVNARTLGELEQWIQDGLDAGQGVAAMKWLAGRYVGFAQQHMARWSALFEHRLPAGRDLPEWYVGQIRALFTVVQAPLLPMVNGDTQKAEMASKVIWSGIHGICELMLAGKLDAVEAHSITEMTDSFIDCYCRGLVMEGKNAA